MTGATPPICPAADPLTPEGASERGVGTPPEAVGFSSPAAAAETTPPIVEPIDTAGSATTPPLDAGSMALPMAPLVPPDDRALDTAGAAPVEPDEPVDDAAVPLPVGADAVAAASSPEDALVAAAGAEAPVAPPDGPTPVDGAGFVDTDPVEVAAAPDVVAVPDPVGATAAAGRVV
ncbi:MAG: hypothetical protein AB7Q27_23985, partial [Acidimicrobiia bacterium]